MKGNTLERFMLGNFIRDSYRKKHKPGSAYFKFKETFGFNPKSEYFLNAIFGENPIQESKNEYYDFLRMKYPDDDSSVFKFYFLEFQEIPIEGFNEQKTEKKAQAKTEQKTNRFNADYPWHKNLGVSAKASKSEIRTAFIGLSQIYHPDKPTGNLEIMQIINVAYDQARDKTHGRYSNYY